MIATVFLIASFAVSSMPQPEYADCEVLTNCTFDVGQSIFGQFRTSPPVFLFDPAWNAAKVVQRGQPPATLRVSCSVGDDPIVLFLK